MAADNFEDIKARIAKEEKRLVGIYKDIEANRKKTIIGLIQRAAFMRVSLEELEEEINIYMALPNISCREIKSHIKESAPPQEYTIP